MALNKLKFNSINVTPAASEALKFNSSANGFETGSAGGAMTFIKKLTASSSSTLSFVDGSSDVVLDNTYKEYVFHFNNIHPSTGSFFTVGFRDGGTDYDAVKTTSSFRALHREDANSANVAYDTDDDLAQSTDFQRLTNSLTADDDGSASGILHLFNPSQTTFVKHFISRSSGMVAGGANYAWDELIAGYCNTTTAIDGVQFKMSSGNIDAGTITLYGIN